MDKWKSLEITFILAGTFILGGVVGAMVTKTPEPENPVLMVQHWSPGYSSHNLPFTTITPTAAGVCEQMIEFFHRPEAKHPLKTKCVAYPYADIQEANDDNFNPTNQERPDAR